MSNDLLNKIKNGEHISSEEVKKDTEGLKYIVRNYKEREADKISKELLNELVPFNILEKYYKFGQASIIASLLNWSKENEKDEPKIENFYSYFNELLEYYHNQDKTMKEIVDRLLKDYE